MTDLLKDMMNERADGIGAPNLDVPAMVREGDQRATRRRNGVLGLVAAAAVVAGIAVPTLSLDRDTAREVEPASLFAGQQPSWAVGSTVHVGGEQIDVGRPVSELFVTTDGVVFTDERGTVYASDGTGTPEEIGAADRSFGSLVGDGSRAGWIEHEGGSAPVFVIYDQSTGERQEADYDTAGQGATEYHPSLFAIDGDDAYLRDARGMIRWDLASGRQTLLGRPQGAEVADVKSGVIAYTLPADDAGALVFAGRDFTGGTRLSLPPQDLTLNPSGTRLLGAGPGPSVGVVDTSTGELWPVTASGYGQITPVAWVDDDTYAAVGSRPPTGPDQEDLLSCDVGDPSCTVLAADFTEASESVVFSLGFPRR